MNTDWQKTGLPFIKTDKQITITCPDGQPRSVLTTDKLFAEVVKAIADKNWEIIPDLLTPTKPISDKFSSTFTVKGDVVYVGDEALPYSLSMRILDFAKNNLPVEPLLRFWANLNLNPSYRSVQQLHDFLEKNNHPLTVDGCFLAYRRVSDDFKDFYTNKVDNSIGAEVSMPRNRVNEDPTQTCSYGLHVANYEYACNFYHSGSGRLVAVKVNPKDVVAVPTDYNQAKMRVCAFTVLEEIKAEYKKSPLYGASADYNEEDEEYEDDYDEEDDEEDDDYDDDDKW